MYLPLIENLARPNGSKILWAVCDSFGNDGEDGSRKYALDQARTPNFDGLCAESETGLLKTRTCPKEASVDFDAIAHLSSLEINGPGGRPVLGRLLGSARVEAHDGLMGAEHLLEARWTDYDFFVLRMGRRGLAGDLGNALNRIEWIEMLDAWLPGLFARFTPDVFALSGEIWAEDNDGPPQNRPSPVLLHSKKSRPLQSEGFTLECCRRGRLGSRLSVRHWLLLLLAHAERLDEVVMEPDARPLKK